MICKKKFSSLLNKANILEKDYINKMFAFAQGQISSDTFINMLKTNNGMEDFILNDKKIPDHDFERKNFERMRKDNFQSHESKYDLYRLVYSFFIRRRINGDYYNFEYESAKVIRENTPEYLYFDLDEVLEGMPKELTKVEQIQWCIERCKQLSTQYKYDKVPPQWVQNEQWPKFNNRLMVFSHQEDDGDKVIYYFYDDETGEQDKIIQYL